MNSKPNIILIISFILLYALSLVAFVIDETMYALFISVSCVTGIQLITFVTHELEKGQ